VETDHTVPLSESLARFDPSSDLPPKPETDCPRCLARWPRPGLCDWCTSRVPPQPPAPLEAVELARIIPQRFRDARWSNLAELRNDCGDAPRLSCPAQRLAGIRAALCSNRRGVLIGPPGAGKTTIAGAWAWHQIALGVDRVRWFSALRLLENKPRESLARPGVSTLPSELALSAGALVIDDLGAELEGAPPGSGLLAQRMGAASRIIAERFDRQRPTLITTGFDVDAVAAHYGERCARRVFEGAATVRLGAASR
jgi:hypothetical protein